MELGPMLEPKLPDEEPMPRAPEVLDPRSPAELEKPLPPAPGTVELLAPILLFWKPGLSEPPLSLPLLPPKMLLSVFASSVASTFCSR